VFSPEIVEKDDGVEVLIIGSHVHVDDANSRGCSKPNMD
jgi:hypothetical protein